MSVGPAIYLGQVGSTGRSTGPHAHKEVIDLRTGKRIPLSQARSDIGQRIQFRLPGSKDWQQLYRQTQPGQFELNPLAPMTSPKGMRTHPVTGKKAYHQGEDYSLPTGTDLRFMGSGSVEGIANYGNAGNVGRLRTGDNRYQLDIFHLNKLPGAAKVGDTTTPAAPQLPGATTAPTPGSGTEAERERDILKSFMLGTRYQLKGQEKEKPKSFSEQLKENMVSGLIGQAMNPNSFLGGFVDGDPYLGGRSAALQDYLSGIFG